LPIIVEAQKPELPSQVRMGVAGGLYDGAPLGIFSSGNATVYRR